MKDNNAKAPKVRSGDDINPVLGSIIKISAIIVIAALIVLIVIVTVKLIQNKNATKSIFSEERIEISKYDYEELVDATVSVEDISNADVKKLLQDKDEDVVIYFYFYYSNFKKETAKENKDEVAKLNALDENVAIFIVDLYEPVTEDNQETTILDMLRNDSRLNKEPIEINTVLNATNKDKKHNKKYLTFVLALEFDMKNEKAPFTLTNGTTDNKTNVLVLLETLK